MNPIPSSVRHLARQLSLATVLAAVAAAAAAQAPSPTMRLRGTIEKVDAKSLVLKERGGETITLAMAADFAVNEVLPIELSEIRPNSYVGTAAMPTADGKLQAIEVLVFPEAARGSGEGHYPWDLQPNSTMTNATVADVTTAPQGRRLTLRYKDGEKTVDVPVGVPVVTFKPGDRSLLVPGAKVMITAQDRDGTPTATRALAGRNGFAPPM